MSLLGKQIDRYRIIEQLGQGGMAVVYKAYDTRLEREVAFKVIRTEEIPKSQRESLLQRFEREAKSQALFDHPNIVPIYDYGEFQGSPYLVMAIKQGGTLKDLTGSPMAYQQAAALLAPIANALGYAHQQGIIHRDVKPSNILLDGRPMLTDFGIAKILETEDATITGTGLGVGTPEYMAPEQWRGKPVLQTDIYALGVVFYELVTGKKPYTAETPAAIIIKQATDPLPRPMQYVPDLPSEVEQILFKALALRPEDRYGSMEEFEEALNKTAGNYSITQIKFTGNKIANNSNDEKTFDQLSVNSKKKNYLWVPIVILCLIGGLFGISRLLNNRFENKTIDSLLTALPSIESTILEGQETILSQTQETTLTSTQTPDITNLAQNNVNNHKIFSTNFDYESKNGNNILFGLSAWDQTRKEFVQKNGLLEISSENSYTGVYLSNFAMQSITKKIIFESIIIDKEESIGKSIIKVHVDIPIDNSWEDYWTVDFGINSDNKVICYIGSSTNNSNIFYEEYSLIKNNNESHKYSIELDIPNKIINFYFDDEILTQTSFPSLENGRYTFVLMASTDNTINNQSSISYFDDISLYYQEEEPVSIKNLKACMLLDGFITDSNFNQQAYSGLIKAQNDFDIGINFREVFNMNKVGTAVSELVVNDCSLIIPVGYSWADSLKIHSLAYPDVHFSIVDVNWIQGNNIQGSYFNVNQPSFLAGYLAASISETGIVATFGGMQIESVTNFMDGFADGVEYYNLINNQSIEIIGWNKNSQKGVFSNDFSDITVGQSIAKSLLNQGADVIFPVAGNLGFGALKEISTHGNGYVIGVDEDWTQLYPNYESYILASVTKNFDVFVYDAIEMELNDSFTTETWQGVLNNNGVGLIINEELINSEILNSIQEVKEQIDQGEIIVE